jgi:peptidyl-prolyl cis-trans isomerase B (cyclophilin B)
MKKLLFTFAILISVSISFAQKPSKKDYLVTISTPYGEMYAILYDEAPKHKANFVRLADSGFYNGTLFHRIIDGFMIQGGDPNSINAQPGQPLGSGDIGYTTPAEINEKLFHKKGVLAAARDNNPAKASSGCQFYIAQGKPLNDQEMAAAERRAGRKITDEQKQVYKTVGGIPHLDGNYTVFGEVFKGVEVIDTIAKQPRDQRDRPTKNIPMQVKVEKMKKKKITKKYGYVYKK